jgi:NADH dehydrogenase/NADH:ubiquinone oxidoreductase subunit G
MKVNEMITLKINGTEVQAKEGQTLLEVIRSLGIEIPTLCYNEKLSPYGACRLCVVEVGGKLVSACTYPVKEGLVVKTHSERVIKARKMLVELLLSISPSSRVIQDLASKMGVDKVRFKKKEGENCILCGLCVRMCAKIRAWAIGFAGRGQERRITTPFDEDTEACRKTCSVCIHFCPIYKESRKGWKNVVRKT